MPTDAESFTVNLKPDIIAALRADAKVHGLHPAAIVEKILDQKYATGSNREFAPEDPDEFWDAMTDEEQQAEIRAVEEGIADAEAGRLISQAEVIRRASERLGIPTAHFNAPGI